MRTATEWRAQREAAQEICEQLVALARKARHAKLEMLAYLIDLAVLEAAKAAKAHA